MYLNIGVTGHRDLVSSEIPALKEKVQEFFIKLRNDYPTLDLQLITPLAEGSDQLVAEVAVDLDIPIVIPLPMPQCEYEKDFSSAKSINKFRELLLKGRQISLMINSDPKSFEQKSERDSLYSRLGIFVSNHCQILLALWDGNPSEKVGGTASVVNYHLTEIMPGNSKADKTPILLLDNEKGLIYHISCSRNGHKDKEQSLKPLQTTWLNTTKDEKSKNCIPEHYKIILHRWEEFSQDNKQYSDAIKDQGNDLLEHSPDYELPEGIKSISNLFKAADWLAIYFQKRTSAGHIIIYSLAVLMGLFFILYSEFDGNSLMISLFLLTFVIGFAVYKIGENRQWHRKYLDYRALAESLRVQFYWSLSGVTNINSIEFTNDNFLQKQDMELAWIRQILKSVRLFDGCEKSRTPEWLEWVIKHWVGTESDDIGQVSYYKRKGLEKVIKYKRTSYLGRLSLLTGIAIATVLMLVGSSLSANQRDLFLVAMGILPLIAGIRDAYSHKTAEKELIKQYRYMSMIFTNANRLLDSSEDIEFRRSVLKALGTAALEEDAEWILMHRERPLEHTGL